MIDFVKRAIVQASALHLKSAFLNETWNENTLGIAALDNFLSDENDLVLFVFLENTENQELNFSNQLPDATLKKVVVFSKTYSCVPHNKDFLKELQITSISGTPTLALYEILNKIFHPLLKKHSEGDIQRNIATLQSNLQSIIFRENPDIELNKLNSDNSLSTLVNSLEDEIKYWDALSTIEKNNKKKRQAISFMNILKPIANDFSIIEALPVNEVEDLLERAYNAIDDLWKNDPPYPKNRMKYVMDIIAQDIWTYARKQFKSCDLWNDDFNKVSDTLLQSIDVGEKWLLTCGQLTGLLWPNYSANPWKEVLFQPKKLVQFTSVLKEVLSIRTVHRQLVRLLTPEEQSALENYKIFEPFKAINVLCYGEDIFNALSKAQKEFEFLLQPAEKRVALKLKNQLVTINTNTRQLIYEFFRYSELICRPVLKKTLYSERLLLLSSLHDYVQQIQYQSNSEKNKITTKQEPSDTIREIIFIRQLEAKAIEVNHISQKLLQDLDGFDSIKEFVFEVLNDLKEQHNELFNFWASAVLSDISNKSLSLKETDPVVQFSRDKLMHVNYPSRLITLISEVRQLKAVGYHIPSLIEETSEHAKKFMTFARILEQIANFHNTIGDRMISSQKPMMLTSALELSKLVQDQEVVSWGQEKSVEKYVETLKRAVEKLSQHNNLLTSHHIDIIDKIKELENVNLFKEFDRWKETIKDIKSILSNIENKGFKNMQSWKSEIDNTICEILEIEYVKNLHSIHRNLQEIRVDLVYRNAGLDLFPNKSNLDLMYEQQLNKYLDIPKSFKGISEKPESIFSKILERNATALETIYKKKEELFNQLAAVMKHWQSWLQLGNLNTKTLTSWQQWDLHFRASKTFGQEIAKLPSSEERVGCFIISLSRLRSDLESHNRSHWDQLVYSLKDSIEDDVFKLQNYIDSSTVALTKQPVTMEEIGESGFIYTNIIKDHDEMEIIFNDMLQKSKVLASWSRKQVDSANRLKGAWERLGSLINNQQHIMAKQLETLRTTLNIEKENLLKEIKRFEAKWNQIKTIQNSFDSNDNNIKGLNRLFQETKEKRMEWNLVLEKKDKLFSNYSKFTLEIPDIVIIFEVEDELNQEELSWSIFKEFYNEFELLCSEYWIVFRKKLNIFEEFLNVWENKLESKVQLNYVSTILQELKKYKDVIPTLKYVRGENFSENHWEHAFSILQIDPKPLDQLLLGDFLRANENLYNRAKELQLLSKKAASEIVVRQALKDIDEWEVHTKFILTLHSDSNGLNMTLIKDFKDVLNVIGDHQILLQSLKNLSDFNTFAERANIWEKKLENLEDNLNLLAQIQKKWIYLEPIFESGTLTQEKSRFDRLNRDFRKILTYIENDPRVTELCRYSNLNQTLQTTLEQLLRCQHSLDNFLKEKRDVFPRFLFLSDDNLLEVVGQSSKEQVIQSHLKKIFAGINCVKLDSSGEHIVAMCSSQGELVYLRNGVFIKKPVEEWMDVLVKEMQSTLKELLVICQRENHAPDPLKYPSQILCLSNNINFTLKCEQAIGNMSLPSLLAKYKMQLSELSSLELTSNIEDASQKDDIVLQLKLKALLLDTIHHIGVLEELLTKNISKVSDWRWQKQLRYYTNSTGDVILKMAKARMEYSYEYLGNDQKLVRTPLTEKCFLTLTQAMHLGLGGNPYGPAGTGKTESVKALGSLLGRQVLVFNCDEGIDSNSMATILTGLVKTGAWGCFDEFNRLDEATLSAVSMHVHLIQEALRNKLPVVNLAEQEVPVNIHCGVFVTLNPAGDGYEGRNKLPDNLKQLFWPVVMTHPDHEQIARTLLYCDGYRYADMIAKKIVEAFKIFSKIMSHQQHYDWGLRAIKTVLSGCQIALKKLRLTKMECNNISQLDEMSIAVNILRDDVLSKLTYADSLKFNKIVKNVFKDIPFENMENEILTKAIKDSYKELNFVINEKQINKCLEFYKQLKQRMGVAIIGPSGSGKSTIIQIVTKALSKLKQKIKIYPVNPKSISRQLLLGSMDNLGQWNDGVLTNYSLQASSDLTDVWSWIVCDGDIDPDWVESLNSVLDDNHLLTLPSGWRIHFGANVNFIFETHELKNASPATISRMGIVFLSNEEVSVTDYIHMFINNLPEENKNNLGPLLEDLFFKGVNWVVNEGETTVPRCKISIAKTGLSQVLDVKTKTYLSVAMINGLGMQLQQDFRELFAQQVFEWTEESMPPFILRSYYDEGRDIIDPYQTNSNIIMDDIKHGIPIVMTGQIMQYINILKIWLKEHHEVNFLMVGQHGSAKRLTIENVLSERSDVDIVTIHCSPYLSTNFIIYQLQQNSFSVSTYNGKVLKPKKGHLVLYFRNMHMLKQDKWGTNMVIEFVNQLVEYKGFFDLKTEFIKIENVTIIGTLVATNKLSTRFLSKMHLLNINYPEQEDLSIITVSYLSAIIKIYFPPVNIPKSKIVKLATTMIAIFEKIKNTFLSAQQKHYIFSPHDLINWCTSLKYYKTDDNMEFESFLTEVISYEALKRFGNKLVGESDQIKFHGIVDETFKHYWDISRISEKVRDMFCIPRNDLIRKKIVYEKVSKEKWHNEVKQGIAQFGIQSEEMQVIINDPILNLTATVMRVLALPKNHIILVGKSGVGRKTAIKISSALLSSKLLRPANGSSPFFESDLKFAIQYAGLECQDVILILEDHIFLNKINLNLINLLITSGEVPDLYTNVELESLARSLKEKSDNENFEGELRQFFANNVKEHLHVVVCLNSNNKNIWDIILGCPAFSQCSTTIWLDNWKTDTIEDFPDALVKVLSSNQEITCSSYFPQIYKYVEKTPIRYIFLIKLYTDIYKEKGSVIKSKIYKLETGVSKLMAAKDLVSVLKQKAIEQQDKLADKQSKANTALDMISNTMKGSNAHKEEMEILKKKTERENNQLMKRKYEIEAELSEVEPLIQEARSAVENIKSESLSEIRSLRAPPDIIRDILEGVLRLMGTQDTSWNSMKTFLAKRGVKEEIRSFHASRIQTENRQAVERLMSTKKDSFDPKSAKRASVAAAPLAAWVEANVKYSKVLDKIRPLEREQDKLKVNLDNAKTQLGELSAGLLDVDTTVSKLKEQLSTYTKEAAEIEIGLTESNLTLSSAKTLVYKLEDEYQRWQEQLEELSEDLRNLPNHSLLAAGFITFLSEKSELQRRKIMDQWCSEMNMEKFNFILFFSTEREQLQWQTEGLSSDKRSIENAITIKKGILSPLVIDPTSTAVRWLKIHYGAKPLNFECVTQNSLKFKTILETSIRFGKILLVEEVEEVSYTLLTVLREEFVYQGERKMVDIFGKQIDYNSNFKLILCSRNELLILPTDIAPFITVLNFNVTHSGLIEQLLSIAIKQEKPELESKRKQLFQENEELEEKQYLLQSRLLEFLANSSGNILHDKNLLASLNDTKASSVAVSNALEESIQVTRKLREEYDIFLEISSFGSKMYFACSDFSRFNILYSLSTTAFCRLFLASLQTVQSMKQNSSSLRKYLFQSVYHFMSRGMFKKDRLAFLFHLVYSLFTKEISKEEINIFLGNATYKSFDENDTVELPSWIPKTSISIMQNVKATCPDLFAKLQVDEPSLWSNFMESSQCEKEFPQHCNISEFQKVLIVQALRSDRLYSSIEYCILHIADFKTTDPPILSLQHVLKESNSMEPIMLITTSGTDPSSEIRDLAKLHETTINEIALGEDQKFKALNILEKCKKNDGWLILKNLHLVTYWLPVLAQNVKNDDASTNFRLWLITEPTERFSFVLAQNSLKIAYEEPLGIGNNLQRIYSSIGDKYLSKSSTTSTRILFVFSCIHALLQERRNYIPQGWSKYYEFNNTDIQTSLNLTEDLWKHDTSRVQWQFITGLLNEAVYGGRIENIADGNILKSYLKKYFHDEVLSHKWKPFDLNISLPNTGQIQDYINIIKKFPQKDVPTVFGLPANIDKSREKQISTTLIFGLKAFYQAQNNEIEKNYKGLVPYFNLWKKLNHGQNFIKIAITENIKSGSAMETFVNEEYAIGITLIQTIHKCFTNLNKVIKGLLEPDDTDVSIADCLLKFQTPTSWLRIWNGPKEPNHYLQTVLHKTVNISSCKSQNPNYLTKEPINLSSFFYPEAFLASSKQDYSRATHISSENLILQSNWKSSNNYVTALSGLRIEGGVFENKMLTECKSNSDSINFAPNCYLNWTEKSKLEAEECINVPLYSSSTRELKIATLQVQSDVNKKEKWILSGLAFYLNY